MLPRPHSIDQRRPRGTQSVAVPRSGFPPPPGAITLSELRGFQTVSPWTHCRGNQSVDR